MLSGSSLKYSGIVLSNWFSFVWSKLLADKRSSVKNEPVAEPVA